MAKARKWVNAHRRCEQVYRTRAQNLSRGKGAEGPHADATAGGAQQLEAVT
jgi:hypothetical protein